MGHRLRGNSVAIAGAGMLLALALAARSAFAYCRTTTCAVSKPPPSCTRDLATGCWQAGIPIFWPQQCISYAVNTEGWPRLGLEYAAATAIIDGAFAHWPAVTCSDGGSPSVAVMGRSGLTCDRVEYNSTGPNANAILFRDDHWSHSDTAYAVTTVTFNPKTGQILDADMELNTQKLTAADINFVVTHESGHFLGLDHSPDPLDVMYSSYEGGGRTPDISDDDVDAICTVYPTSRPAPACSFEPPKGYATDCGGDVIAACAVAPEPLSPEVTSSPVSSAPGWIDGVAIGAVALTLGARRRRR